MFEIRRIRQFIRIKTSVTITYNLEKTGSKEEKPGMVPSFIPIRFLNNDGRPDFGGT